MRRSHRAGGVSSRLPVVRVGQRPENSEVELREGVEARPQRLERLGRSMGALPERAEHRADAWRLVERRLCEPLEALAISEHSDQAVDGLLRRQIAVPRTVANQLEEGRVGGIEVEA